MPRGKYVNHKGRSRKFTAPEELQQSSDEESSTSDEEIEGAAGTSSATRVKKTQKKNADESSSEQESDESEDDRDAKKGVAGLIAIENPNRHDDSFAYPDFVCDEIMPSCSNGRRQMSTETISSNESFSFSEELIGVNKILFSEEFFKILKMLSETEHQKKMNGLIAVCSVCNKKVRGSLRVSSNFIKHLKHAHPNNFSTFKSKRQEIKQSKNNNRALNRNILNFICQSTSPLVIVKHKSFKELFPGKKIPSRRSITRLLEESHNNFVEAISCEIQQIEHVCVTADVWSGGRKSFFGYTCHWLNSESLERKSVALACRRFKEAHSFEKIAKMICDINTQYKLTVDKIVYTVTDNGSNFIKAFKEFGVELKHKDVYGSDEESESSCEFESDSESTDASDIEFRTVTPPLSKHFPCASHTLNLIATTDFNNILKSASESTREIHKRSFDRCTQIWNKSNRPKSAEVIADILHANLLSPCSTRWNSLHDSVKRLLDHKDKLAELCYHLAIPTFLDNEVHYLEEYVKLMGPIAEAIDYLQGIKNMYFGHFLPAIVSLRIKLRRLDSLSVTYLGEVRIKLQDALLRRFEKYFLLEPCAWDAVVAAICVPSIKLRFVKALLETATSHSEEDIKKMFNAYVAKYGKLSENSSLVSPEPTHKSFFDFGEESNEDTKQYISSDCTNYLKETLLYLIDIDDTTNSLNNHRAIKNVFLKYNTPLPSSAPVERLLSFAGIVNRSRRQKLRDQNFEMLVLRKANSIV